MSDALGKQATCGMADHRNDYISISKLARNAFKDMLSHTTVVAVKEVGANVHGLVAMG